MRNAQRLRRATEIGGTALGILVGSAAAVLALTLTVPPVLGRESPLPVWVRLIWPAFVAVLLLAFGGLGGWLLALRVAEARYDRRRDSLTRSAYSMYDYWAAIPDLPPGDLWDLLDRYEKEGVGAYADVSSPWDERPR